MEFSTITIAILLSSRSECFYEVFEEEIHQVIVENQLFKPSERIALGASGGKDSTVFAYVLSKLNRRHNYGLELFLLSVDEGITGYRDDSLQTIKRNEFQYGLPLKIVSYKDLCGWTMNEIVKMIGLKNNCTFCGVFHRQEVYEQQKEFILLGEMVVLATLAFDLNVNHPYKPLVEAIKKFKVTQNALAEVAIPFKL
ncbi:PREDICTED: cytoplasmic tRNA 2-thiolation protein 1-like [Prunus mume]|uniref:Cytoplasmic tRNA 2-thiolation protein 1-like n=1 Tax=Prunus mume TaxID=102107 RepID=A0ABM1LVR1_PRUMU|nr:PREDICTED: cytoplasmic tRNA 2-thiolation protein 1-like [Prunus mume]